MVVAGGSCYKKMMVVAGAGSEKLKWAWRGKVFGNDVGMSWASYFGNDVGMTWAYF